VLKQCKHPKGKDHRREIKPPAILQLLPGRMRIGAALAAFWWLLAGVFALGFSYETSSPQSTRVFTRHPAETSTSPVVPIQAASDNSGQTLSTQPNQPGAIFLPATPPSYTVTVDNLSVISGPEDITYIVDNVNGAPIASGQVPIQVSANSTQVATVSFSLPSYGYDTVTFALTSASGTPITTLAATSLANLPEPAPESAATNPVGINGNLSDANPGIPLANVFQVLTDQDDGWYRLALNPSTIFPNATTAPQWATVNAGVTIAETTGIQLIGVISGWPDGMNPFGSNANVSFSTALSAYISSVQQLVTHYAPGGTVAKTHHWATYGINTWEIWNEPVTATYWGGTAAQYAALAQATAEAIRAIDPSATILAYDDDASALAAQGPGLYSGLSLHYYPGTLPPDNPSFGLTPTVTQAVYSAQTVGGSLWLTEAGWSTLNVSPVAQAQNWVDTVLDGLTAGASHVLPFTQIYPGSGFSDEHPNLTPKPAYAALAVLNDTLAGTAPSGPMPLASTILADTFSQGPNTVVALWTTDPSVQMTLPANNLACHAQDWMGNALAPAGSPVALNLSQSPVYLVCPDTSTSSVQGWLDQGLPVERVSPGTVVGTTQVTATPNLPGQTLAAAIATQAQSVPTMGGPLPTGAFTYTSGSNLNNVAVGDDIELYTINSTGQITAWNQIPVTAADIAAQAPPITDLSVSPGPTPGSTEVLAAPNTAGDTFAIDLSAQPGPAVGEPLPLGAVAYHSGTPLDDVAVGETIDLYEVNAEHQVEAWTPITLTNADLPADPGSPLPTLSPESVTVDGVTTTVIGNLGFNPARAIAYGTSVGFVEERAAILAGASFHAEGTDSSYLSAILSGVGVGLQHYVSAIQQGQFAASYQSLGIIPTWTNASVTISEGLAALKKAAASPLSIENYLVQLWGYSWTNALSAATSGF